MQGAETLRGMISENLLKVTALTVTACALLLAFGCSVEMTRNFSDDSPSDTATIAGDNWLSEELRSIPADYGNTFLWFVNLRVRKRPPTLLTTRVWRQ